MYLLYVVPIQGRDAEISHMKYITQEFIGLKADIDGLIINDKINLPIARSFELGTLSSVGSGALSIMPMSSYIEASGTLMVNEQNDFLEVIVNGDMTDISSIVGQSSSNFSRYYSENYLNFYPKLTNISCKNYDQCPPNPINFTINDRFYNITAKRRDNYLLHDNNGVLNLTIPHTYFNISTDASGTGPNESIVLYYENSTTYDLMLEIWDNRTWPRLWDGERTLINNISLNVTYGTNYTVNILNDIITNNSSEFYENYYSNVQSIKTEPSNYMSAVITNKNNYYPPRIGSLQYESSNRYWVNQNLLYEMGGLFLNQPSDQGSSVMLVPSIAITPIKNPPSEEYYLKVSINNIRITDTEDISGSVSAQIFTKVDQIHHNIFNGTIELTGFGTKPTDGSIHHYKLKEANEPNAHAIWLQFIPDDPRVTDSNSPPVGGLTPTDITRMKTSTELWKRGFDQIKTITNKTLSDNSKIGGSDNSDIGRYSGYIYTFRIEDNAQQRYSANLIIGETASEKLSGITKCPPITYDSTLCLPEASNYITTTCKSDKPFILDYSESEISLVMQSGAL